MFYNKCGRTACCLWYGCSDCDCSFAHVLYCSSEAPFVTIVLRFMYAWLFMCSVLNHHLLWLWCSDYTFDRAATALWNRVRLIARYKAPVCTDSIRSVVQDFLHYWCTFLLLLLLCKIYSYVHLPGLCSVLEIFRKLASNDRFVLIALLLFIEPWLLHTDSLIAAPMTAW